MRFLSLILISLFLINCSNNKAENNQEKQEEKVRELIELKDGIYTEWYPGHKQIKVRGRQDEDEKRQGIWKLYGEDGTELSITIYTDDKKDGHIVVRHPNGAVRYVGEYIMDERVGEWRFYNEQGDLIKTEDFGYPED